MNGSKHKHNEMVSDLERMVKERFPDDTVLINWEYFNAHGKLLGEIDVLHIRPNYWVMYEVKSGTHSYHKAYCQFRRFHKHFNKYNIKGVYMDPLGLQRMRV